MGHVILLGDSILDNGAYVSGGSPIVEQLQSRLPRGWRVTLLACDGAATTDVLRQLQRVPPDATHLVLSAGGNDALECIPIVKSPVPDSTHLLAELVAMQSEFRVRYQHLVSTIRKMRLPTIGCTIYDAVPGLDPIERMTMSLFNDIIVRELVAVHLPVLELRLICNGSRDFSAVSPIEPSEIGGTKIARAIQHVLLGHDFSRTETAIYH